MHNRVLRTIGLQISTLGIWGWGPSQKLLVLDRVYQEKNLNCFRTIFQKTKISVKHNAKGSLIYDCQRAGQQFRGKLRLTEHIFDISKHFYWKSVNSVQKSVNSKVRKTFLVSYDFDCFCYSFYFFQWCEQAFSWLTRVMNTVTCLKTDQKNYISAIIKWMNKLCFTVVVLHLNKLLTIIFNKQTLHKISYGLGHIHWRNAQWKTSSFM